MRFVPLEGDLREEGWATFDAVDLTDDELLWEEELRAESEALREATDILLTVFSDAGFPTKFSYGRAVSEPEYGIGNGLESPDIQILQAQRNADIGFSRVATDFVMADANISRMPDDTVEMHALSQLTFGQAQAVGAKALLLFDVQKPQTLKQFKATGGEPKDGQGLWIPRGRTQFIHTWYDPGGKLFGDEVLNQVGHEDTEYEGIILSQQLNPETEAEWTIKNHNGTHHVQQTGRKIVMLSGHVNPYHLVEVQEDSPSREAVLLRLGGSQAVNLLMHKLLTDGSRRLNG